MYYDASLVIIPPPGGDIIGCYLTQCQQISPQLIGPGAKAIWLVVCKLATFLHTTLPYWKCEGGESSSLHVIGVICGTASSFFLYFSECLFIWFFASPIFLLDLSQLSDKQKRCSKAKKKKAKEHGVCAYSLYFGSILVHGRHGWEIFYAAVSQKGIAQKHQNIELCIK